MMNEQLFLLQKQLHNELPYSLVITLFYIAQKTANRFGTVPKYSKETLLIVKLNVPFLPNITDKEIAKALTIFEGAKASEIWKKQNAFFDKQKANFISHLPNKTKNLFEI